MAESKKNGQTRAIAKMTHKPLAGALAKATREASVFQMPKGQSALLVAECNEYKGRKQFQVMEKWKEEGSDEWRFGKKIVNFGNEHGIAFVDWVVAHADEIKEHLSAV